jgi:hypothetical protein
MKLIPKVIVTHKWCAFGVPQETNKDAIKNDETVHNIHYHWFHNLIWPFVTQLKMLQNYASAIKEFIEWGNPVMHSEYYMDENRHGSVIKEASNNQWLEHRVLSQISQRLMG